MLGPEEAVESMRQNSNELGELDSLQFGTARPLGHFLGCQHDQSELEIEDGDSSANTSPA